MTAVELPRDAWNATNSNAASAGTRAAAGYPAGGWLVTVDTTHHEAFTRFKDGCCANAFQAHFRLGRVHSQRESGMDERVERFCEECAEVAARSAQKRFLRQLGWYLDECESEIERLLLAAFLRLEVTVNIGPPEDFRVKTGMLFSDPQNPEAKITFDEVRGSAWDEMNRAEAMGMLCAITFVYPQVSFGPYRVDFLLGHLWIDVVNEYARWEDWIVVECDGHEFHDRTKEQARRDKARDRFLVASGVRVMRFTGSEIWRDPMACAVEALQAVDPDRLGGWRGEP